MTHIGGPSRFPSGPAPSRQFITGCIISDGRTIDDGLVAYEDGRIAYAGPAQDFDDAGWTRGRELSAGSLLLPGLVDVHCHGGFGGDFPSGDEQSARKAVDFLHRMGTTTLLASTVTAAREDLLTAFSTLAGLAHEGLIAGIHAEGPFLSHARRGSQDPRFVATPDLDFALELIEAAEGKLITMTYAPELQGSDALIDLLTTHGVTPSVGHTDCDAATAAASLARAREELGSGGFDGYSERPTVTHLFNGMRPFHHRSPGPAMACLLAAAAGNAVVELIADGVHLDPQTVLGVFELVGAQNIALVTDSMAASGLQDGTYPLGPGTVTVDGGVARLGANGELAGGTASMLDVVREAVAAGVSIEDAVTSATDVPANILGLADEVGSLHLGFSADVVVATPDLRLEAVLRNGQWLAPIGG